MDKNYDVIILGTGIKECILSGLLSKTLKDPNDSSSYYQVLHLDRNDYYGAESASLNLKQLFTKFDGNDEKMDEQLLGKSKNYSIDLCPKFLMGCGKLVKMLLFTEVTKYLEFRCVGGSFVYKDGKLYEVPVTPQAALNSSLMGIFQKRRYKNFLQWAIDVKEGDEKSYKGVPLKKKNWTMQQVYDYWKCDKDTITFTGHAIALYPDDSYLTKPELTFDCISRIQMYAWSLSRFEKSPYIYPVWGLGGLPEGFSRLCAVHGGTYMLRRTIKDIKYNNGDDQYPITVEVTNEGTAKCKKLIGDPSYFKKPETKDKEENKDEESMVEFTGRVARWLCILDRPVNGTNNSHSAQIILPTKQTGHKSDIYISVQSSELSVAPKGRWLAMISAQVYTKNNQKEELKIARNLLGKSVLKEFFICTETYKPIYKKLKKNVYITSSMDSTTHFEQTTSEVMDIYKQITGTEVDLNQKIDSLNDQ